MAPSQVTEKLQCNLGTKTKKISASNKVDKLILIIAKSRAFFLTFYLTLNSVFCERPITFQLL